WAYSGHWWWRIRRRAWSRRVPPVSKCWRSATRAKCLSPYARASRRRNGLRRAIVGSAAEHDEDHAIDAALRTFQVLFNLAKSDLRGLFERIAIDPGADGRERDGAQVALFRHPQAGSIAGRQQIRLTMAAIAVDGPHGVENETRRQVAGRGGDGASGGAAAGASANLVELAHQGRSAGAVNGAIHAAAAGQRRIGGVHNGIRGNSRDVAVL